MKTLSVKQPWASLIASGAKNIENRTWSPAYRGDLLIVSSVSYSKQDAAAAREFCAQIGAAYPDKLPLGMALAVVKFTGIAKLDADGNTTTDHPTSDEIDGTWWDDSCTGWILEDVRPIIPFPVIGRLGLYDVDDSLGLIKFLEVTK